MAKDFYVVATTADGYQFERILIAQTPRDAAGIVVGKYGIEGVEQINVVSLQDIDNGKSSEDSVDFETVKIGRKHYLRAL